MFAVLTKGLGGAAVALIVAAAVAGCSANLYILSDSRMKIAMSNGTTIPVNLVVNGSLIVTVPPLTDDQIAASDLPGLPWQVEAQTAAGRTLVTLTVASGSVYDSGSHQSGPARRVDLSCGRLDIWSGPPMMGPMPGPGVPGDCD